MDYLIYKWLHLSFVIAWFAGLFYLPRIFVNLAQTDNQEVYAHLVLMAQRLLRFMTILAVPALVFGLVLLAKLGFSGGWLHTKLLLTLFLLVYHGYCFVLYRRFVNRSNQRSHRWYRFFNEIPVLLLFAIVYLVLVKPF